MRLEVPVRPAVLLLVPLLAAALLAGCGEKPSRPDPEAGARELSNATPQNPLHDRAQTQNEAERIGT
jgi:hypothetical protein